MKYNVCKNTSKSTSKIDSLLVFATHACTRKDVGHFKFKINSMRLKIRRNNKLFDCDIHTSFKILFDTSNVVQKVVVSKWHDPKCFGRFGH